MTLIIGFRCKDGVVVGCDSKILRGGEIAFENKLIDQDNVIFAAEGLTGIRDDFLFLLQGEIQNRKGIEHIRIMKWLVEDIIYQLGERYSERVEGGIGLLIAGLENITSGKAELFYIHGSGYGEKTNFICTGHGGTYAHTIAKYLLDPNLSVEENAKRVALIILWVSEVDTTVGGKPNVAIIRDSVEEDKKVIEYLQEEKIKEIEKILQEIKENFANLILKESD